jgi:hypothetical protein
VVVANQNMTDAIMKLADMHMQQQRSIEYERQRHLANWLIESSPHMPKVAVAQSQCQQAQNKKHKKIFTTSIFHDSFLFLSKFGPSSTATPNQSTEQDQIVIQSPSPIITQHTVVQAQQQQQPHTNLSKSPTAFTSSQTNLPLQIVQSSRDGNKPKLRRFNSHDTSANMFSVADFENARLARRNELELVRQKQRYKVNSLSSGCDSSTGDSKGSKLSNEVSIYARVNFITLLHIFSYITHTHNVYAFEDFAFGGVEKKWEDKSPPLSSNYT